MSKNSYNFDDFFILDFSWATQYFWAQVELSKIPEQFKKNSMRGYLGTVTRELECGTKAPDVLGGDPVMLAVSEKLLSVFKKYKFQKFDVYDTKIIDKRPPRIQKKSDPIPKYYGISVLSSAGPVDDIRSQTVFDETGFPKKRTGLYFHLDKWDGSDLFYLGNGGWVIVTRMVKEALEKEGIKGYRLIPISEYGK